MRIFNLHSIYYAESNVSFLASYLSPKWESHYHYSLHDGQKAKLMESYRRYIISTTDNEKTEQVNFLTNMLIGKERSYLNLNNRYLQNAAISLRETRRFFDFNISIDKESFPVYHEVRRPKKKL